MIKYPALIGCFVCSSAFLFSSCGSSTVDESRRLMPPIGDSTGSSFARPVKEDFLSILKGISISNINQFIHPKKGLWLIQSSGAMPNMTNTSQVDKNFPVDFSSFKNEELPKIDCSSKIFWTKQGCYAQEINSFKTETIWSYCGLSKEDAGKVAALVETISWTIINTSSSGRYYFALIDGKWYLLFADLRRPCEA